MTQTQSLTRVERIENKIDNEVTSAMEISGSVGGMAFKNMDEVMNFARLMAVSDVAVPPHIRENVGACLAVVIQAVEWRMSPYAVANKSYVVNNRLCFESQLIHAVIEQRAPIVGRLRNRFTGEGDSRRCTVWGTTKGETQPVEYQSPEFGKIQPKNSPLWKTKPDLQLYYNASRDWARMYFPDVIMGVYSEDEIEGAGMPTIRQRVPMPRAVGEIEPSRQITGSPAKDPFGQPLPPSQKFTEEQGERELQEIASRQRAERNESTKPDEGAAPPASTDAETEPATTKAAAPASSAEAPAFPPLPKVAKPEQVGMLVAKRWEDQLPEGLSLEAAAAQVAAHLKAMNPAWAVRDLKVQKSIYASFQVDGFNFVGPAAE